MRRRHAPFAAVLCLLAAAALLPAAAHAQAGRADLRYAAGSPVSLAYVTVDSMHNTARMPMGEMPSTFVMRSVTDVSLVPAASGVTVTTKVRESSGHVSTPMGDMQFPDTSQRPELTLAVRPTGPDSEDLLRDAQSFEMAVGTGPTSFSVLGLLIRVPGRVLSVGETWQDTITSSLDRDGMEGSSRLVVDGTYASDTTIAGHRYHVLHLTTAMKAKMQGTTVGMEVQQEMEASGTDVVLWDPTRRFPVARDSRTTMNMVMHANGAEITMTGRMRSITRLEDLGG